MYYNKSRLLYIVVIFALVLSSCLYLFLHSSFFNIKSVAPSGNKKVSNEEILEIAAIEINRNIFLLNTDFVSKSLKVHPMIREANIIRHLPDSIEISIVERETWALIPFQSVFLCVDEEGFCIDKLARFSYESYPVITMEQMPERVNLGQAVYPQGIKNVKNLWDKLSLEDKEKISDFHLQNENLDIIVYTENGTEIRFGNPERMEEKIAYFKYILEQERTIEAEGTGVIEYVDLRFEGQPVVKTK